MPAITPFAKLIVVAVLALADIVNYVWSIEIMPVRDVQILGVLITILLAGAGMVIPAIPRAGPPHGSL